MQAPGNNQKLNQTQPPELIDAYNREGDRVIESQPIGEVLDYIKSQYLERGESGVAVPVVHIYLFRPPEGDKEPRIILQERSDNHRLDKTVGGHVSAGLTAEEAAEKETSEEMGISVHFASCVGLTALSETVASEESNPVVHVDHDPWQVSGRHDRTGVYYEKPSTVDIFVGLFDGDIEALETDFEVTKFVEFSITELREAMEHNPELFTPDLQTQFEKVLKLAQNAGVVS